MSEYLTITDLTNRLTDAGVKYVADRDRDGEVSPTEAAAYLTSAIVYAGNIVDGYLAEQLPNGTARGSGNPWLLDRAVDIAAWRAAGHGGRSVPKTLCEAKDLALQQLQKIREGERIPGYKYPGPANAWFPSKTPKVSNFSELSGNTGNRRRRRPQI